MKRCKPPHFVTKNKMATFTEKMADGGRTGGTSRRNSRQGLTQRQAVAGATEKGYSRALTQAVLGVENTIRGRRDEELHAFDKNGKEVFFAQGKGPEVRFNPAPGQLKDMVITHNHPRAIGKTGISRIGNSLSINDIYTAIKYNAAEIRAVTPTYTFSIKRPAGGWGEVANMGWKKFHRRYTYYEHKIRKENTLYKNKAGWTEQSQERGNVTYFHRTNKALAKRFGWDYTKKNS